MTGSALDIAVDGITVSVSNPDKVMFGQSGITKADLARYYEAVGSTMLDHIWNRPLTLVRYPNGLEGDSFFQKHTPKHYPEWIGRVELKKKGGTIAHAMAMHPASLVYFAQQNVITPHIGLASADDLDHPNLFVIDLDPSLDDFAATRRVALGAKAALERARLTPFVQLTGSKGLHIVAPLAGNSTWSDSQRFARALTTLLLDEFPDDLTTAFSKAEREDRIYLDMGRNNYPATFAAPYGVRAKPEAPVVTPIEWAELDRTDMHPQFFTIESVPDRIAKQGDPWADMRAAASPLPA